MLAGPGKMRGKKQKQKQKYKEHLLAPLDQAEAGRVPEISFSGTELCDHVTLWPILKRPMSKGPHSPSANLRFSLVAATGGPSIRRSWLEAQWLPGVGEAQLAGQVWGGPKQLWGVWKAFEHLMSTGSN